MIEIAECDITELAVDAIVNAANESLLGGGGVDGAIHRAAGPRLREYNRSLGGCPTGEARISPGFDLPAQWVISTVGPVWHGGDQGEARLLESCYRNAFELALRNDVRSIAFPAISTGVYGYPKEAATRIAVGVMRAYEDRFDRIIACCFSAGDAALYRRILAEL
ncbi:O-acetyl-ADP-ribose deacetylase [Thiohalobacter sp.]|uniref:O-acetyl-ADP-ribose deacetylase n=1 Tax=Thiohalobacter sp. TaxID=2025948 RepID=UPI00260B56D9|nr:O-acetyl-ADP-ribose deacetylase [Thiohalobacter sp.]